MDRDIKDYNDLFSQIIKETDLKDKDPLGSDIKETLTDGFNNNQCPHGRSELDHYCILAYKDEHEDLLCMAMYDWSKHIQVEGLRSCFLTMKYDMKLAETNRRKKGNFKGAKYTKVNRP